MSKRLIMILLFVSLAFNLAVLGMFLYRAVYFRAPLCSQDNRFSGEMMEHRYSKSDRDKERPEFTLANRDEIKKLRSEFMQKRRAFVNILSKQTLNEQEALTAMQASLAAQNALEQKVGTSMLELRKKLTPEQAKDYFQRVLERKHRTRFDNDQPKNIQPEDN